MIIAKSQEGDTKSKTGRARLYSWLKSREMKGPCAAFIRERDRQTDRQTVRQRQRETDTQRPTETERERIILYYTMIKI